MVPVSDNRDALYYRHRFPPEVIAQAVWLYFPLLAPRIQLSADGRSGNSRNATEFSARKMNHKVAVLEMKHNLADPAN